MRRSSSRGRDGDDDWSARVEITEEGPANLAEYARVSIAFEVREIFDVGDARAGPLGGLPLVPRVVDAPYVKDYDALPMGGPTEWPARFDITNWGLLAARIDGRRVGGAAVAFDTPGLDMLEGRRDLAVLWDIRVAPDARGHGVGDALLRAAERWARARGARRLDIETQNVNEPACRFYARHGYALRSIDRLAYPDLPDEVRLIWFKTLVERSLKD